MAAHTALFVVVLSTHSFTGLPRPLLLPASSPSNPAPDLPAHLREWQDKLLVVHHPGRPLAFAGEDPFVLEREQRAAVAQVLEREMRARGKQEGDVVVVMGDVDEVPRAETVELLRTCRWEGDRPAAGAGADPTWGKLHLQLRNYLYSFEWPTDYDSWRLQAHVYAPGSSAYVHSQTTDRVLADAGWHCSFCFRSLREFADKMTGASRPSPFAHPAQPPGEADLCTPSRPGRLLTRGPPRLVRGRAARPPAHPARHLRRRGHVRHVARGLPGPSLTFPSPPLPVIVR